MVGEERFKTPAGNFLQISACAERFPRRTCQHHGAYIGIGLGLLDEAIERLRNSAIDRVARFGAIDSDERHMRFRALEPHNFAVFVQSCLPIIESSTSEFRTAADRRQQGIKDQAARPKTIIMAAKRAEGFCQSVSWAVLRSHRSAGDIYRPPS